MLHLNYSQIMIVQHHDCRSVLFSRDIFNTLRLCLDPSSYKQRWFHWKSKRNFLSLMSLSVYMVLH